MQTIAITLRTLQAEDIGAAMELSVAEGWNQTENDWNFLLRDEHNICVAAINNGKIIGTTIALDYPGKLAWIGMVLVNKAYRGKGISKLLLQDVLRKYKNAMKLDATALGEPVYRKFGFLPEYTISRMVNTKLANTFTQIQHSVRPASAMFHSHIQALDGIIFGAERVKLVKYLLQQYPQKGWILLDDNRFEGFVLGRDGFRYHHIGPVVAISTEHAEILISQAMQKLVGQPAVIDVLSDKKELLQFLQNNGFVEQRQFVRMFKEKNHFAGKPELLYAIAGPEFG